MSMFELRVLQYFLTVAREQNITKAAECLHITQPTLSRQLIQLEKELGKKLFDRGTHQIELTKEGMLLRRRAEELLDLADKAEKEIREESENVCGEIFIGSGEMKAFQSVALVMKQFADKYPHVKFNLYSGNADDLKERINKGLIDIALVTTPVEISNFEFIRMKEKDVWGIVMPTHDLLAEKDKISPQDLKGKKIIHSSRKLVREEIENWFGDAYEQVHEAASINLFHNAICLIKNGMGYGITLENLVPKDDKSICFRPFSPQLDTGSILIWKKHQNFSPATAKFIEDLKHAFKV